MNNLITLIISIISIILSYLLGNFQAEKKYKKNIKLKSYKNFYVPYIKALYRNFIWEYPAHQHTSSVMLFYLDLITENLHHLDTKTLKLYPIYYKSVLDMLEYFDENPIYSNAPTEYNKIFNSITFSILEAGIQLSNKLSLPPLAKPLLDIFSTKNTSKKSILK